VRGPPGGGADPGQVVGEVGRSAGHRKASQQLVEGRGGQPAVRLPRGREHSARRVGRAGRRRGNGGPRAGRAAAHAAVLADHDQMGVVGGGRLGGVLLQPAPRPANAHPAPAGAGHRRGHHRAERDRGQPRGAQPVDDRAADRATGRRGAVVLAAGRLGPPVPVRPAYRRAARAGHLGAVGGAADPARRRGRAGGVLHRLRAGRRGSVPAHGVPGRSGRLRLREGHRRRAGSHRHHAGQPGLLHRLRVHCRRPASDDGPRLGRAGAGRAGAGRHHQAHRHRLDTAGTVPRQGGRRGY
jgi:hypothetical protein